MIPRIPFKPEDKTIPFEFTRKQFPIKVCFAIKSNKSQGQTLDKVCCKKDLLQEGRSIQGKFMCTKSKFPPRMPQLKVQ